VNFNESDLPNLKKIVISVHGYLSSKESPTIVGLSNVLKTKSIGLLAFDLPRHGANKTELSIENCLNIFYHVENALREFKKPICFFSSSFGAYLTLLYLSNNIEKYGEVVLRAPAINCHDTFILLKKQGFRIDDTLLSQIKENSIFDIAHTIKERLHIIHGTQDKIVSINDINKLTALLKCETYPFDTGHDFDGELLNLINLSIEIFTRCDS